MGKAFKDCTSEELSAYGKQGAKKSLEVRRRNRSFRDLLSSLLDMPLYSGRSHSIDGIKNLAESKGKNLSVAEAILLQQIVKAVKGDIKSAEFIRDTSGNMPTNKVEVSSDTVIVMDDIEEIGIEEADN